MYIKFMNFQAHKNWIGKLSKFCETPTVSTQRAHDAK